MASSNYAAWSVVAGEQPTTAKWNILGTNDAAFNTGQGFNDGIILPRHMGSSTDGRSLGSPQNWIRIGNTLIQWGTVTISQQTAATGWTINWAIPFNTVIACTASHNTGWSMNTYGGMEQYSTTSCGGNYRTDTGTVPRNNTIYAIAIGT